jgi:hypothetical protein
LPPARGFAAACADVGEQLARLFPRGFITATAPAQLAHYPRYLKAIALRLEKLKGDAARDAQRLAEIAPLQTAFLRELAARKGRADARLDEFRWLLEELRVSLFAQELRTPMPVSVKRLQKVWDALRRSRAPQGKQVGAARDDGDKARPTDFANVGRRSKSRDTKAQGREGYERRRGGEVGGGSAGHGGRGRAQPGLRT